MGQEPAIRYVCRGDVWYLAQPIASPAATTDGFETELVCPATTASTTTADSETRVAGSVESPQAEAIRAEVFAEFDQMPEWLAADLDENAVPRSAQGDDAPLDPDLADELVLARL